MRSVELNRQMQRLRALESRAMAACGGDVEMLSHWAKYLCVLVAGFLENAAIEVYGGFVRGAATGPVQNYALGRLRGIRNPKAGKFVELATSFKPAWGDELKTYLEEDGRKDAIDTIMQNRHLIAHGKDSGITIVRLSEYRDKAIEVVEFIENQCAQ